MILLGYVLYNDINGYSICKNLIFRITLDTETLSMILRNFSTFK